MRTMEACETGRDPAPSQTMPTLFSVGGEQKLRFHVQSTQANMATETTTTTAPARGRTAQVRIHLRTKAEDIQLPDTGPVLVSTGKR